MKTEAYNLILSWFPLNLLKGCISSLWVVPGDLIWLVKIDCHHLKRQEDSKSPGIILTLGRLWKDAKNINWRVRVIRRSESDGPMLYRPFPTGPSVKKITLEPGFHGIEAGKKIEVRGRYTQWFPSQVYFCRYWNYWCVRFNYQILCS